MKTKLLLILVVGLAGFALCSQSAPAGTLQIVHSIGFPAEAEFGRDIAWDGQYIWSAFFEKQNITTGHEGQGTLPIRSLNPVDGSPGPSFQFGQGMDDRSGIVWDGEHLWVTLTGGISGTPAQTIPDYIYKFEPDGTEAGSFELPGSPDIRVTGLAFDGTYLWLSDSRHDQILQTNPGDMSVINSFPSPGSVPLGLAWNGTSLFSVDGETNNIFQIDTSGNVLEVWSTPLTAPFGITSDGEHFWVLDNATCTIYQLAIPEPSSLALSGLGVIAALLFGWRSRGWPRFSNRGDGVSRGCVK